ncbi:endo-1,4-beta-xylanase [Halosimplex aquaticum]|uniref:endo-1,4-beta-xylanase n=1 Tax=Halosimplex aquaticum TaxID=3026162 RepID=A0ABD5Y9X9_9EURY|nr:endo-1,4-beta-xylanase [Halosimplex aquaticum]
MADEPRLRDVAADRDFEIGAAVAAEPLRTDASYKKILRNEFNYVTAENALKMGPLRPARHTYDFRDADAVVDYAREHDQTVRAHTLAWHNQTPEWFQEWDYTDGQLEDFLRDHVHTTAGRYRSRVDAWDVVNEAVADDGTMRDNLWYDAMGERYLDRAFEWADEVASETDLYYNDYGADGVNEKSDAIYDLVSRMLDRGVPIDGVGLQLHALHEKPAPESVAENVRRFRELDLDVQITEMDVAYTPADDPGDRDARWEKQAEYYRAITEVCLDEGVDTLVVWGVRDSDSWVSSWFESLTGDPLLFDAGNDPKPAYHAIKETLETYEPN